MKRCTNCKKLKDESEFYKNRTGKDGLAAECKNCQRARGRQYYKRHRRDLKRYYSYEQSHRVVDGVKEKRCRRCKMWKAEGKFYKKQRNKDGLADWCKECADKATNKARKRRLAVRN